MVYHMVVEGDEEELESPFFSLMNLTLLFILQSALVREISSLPSLAFQQQPGRVASNANSYTEMVQIHISLSLWQGGRKRDST